MINLFTCFYDEKLAARRDELLYCIAANCNIKSINRIFILEEPPYQLEEKSKLKIFPVNKRPTFDDMFKAVTSNSDSNDLNIIANTDIYFDEQSLQLCLRHMRPNQCFALSRWELSSAPNRAQLNWGCMTQDAWIFKGKPRPLNGNFNMGKLACDNRLAWELRNAGYAVINPCHDMRIYHFHKSNIRNYDTAPSNSVPGPFLSLPQGSMSFSHEVKWTGLRLIRKALKILGISVFFPYEIRLKHSLLQNSINVKKLI